MWVRVGDGYYPQYGHGYGWGWGYGYTWAAPWFQHGWVGDMTRVTVTLTVRVKVRVRVRIRIKIGVRVLVNFSDDRFRPIPILGSRAMVILGLGGSH